jgi:hypothetical protein
MVPKRNTLLRRLLIFCTTIAGVGVTLLLLTGLLSEQQTTVVRAQGSLPVISIDTASRSVDVGEEDGFAEILVVINPPPTQTASIGFFTLNGSAEAGANRDYVGIPDGTLTFPISSTQQIITITINEDSIFEGDETINVVLQNPISATLDTNAYTSIITIEDNESPTVTPSPTVDPNRIFADGLEPNNAFGTAYDTAADADALCDLTFYPPGDNDYFRWWGKAGVTYEVSIPTLAAGLDTVIEVYSSNFNLIGSNDDINAGDFRSWVPVTVNSDGYFYARAFNKTPTDPVDKRYCFEVTSTVLPTSTPFPTPLPFPSEADDCEYNSTIETACLIIANDSSLGTQNFVPSLGSTRDTDIFKMWVKPGISYECETTIPSGSAADTNMIIWDNYGNPFDPWIGNDDKGRRRSRFRQPGAVHAELHRLGFCCCRTSQRTAARRGKFTFLHAELHRRRCDTDADADKYQRTQQRQQR